MTHVLEHANRLVVAIDAIARANDALASLARAQRSAIAGMRTSEVADVVAQQRAIGRELADAEESRRSAVRSLCQALKLPEAASLSDLTRAVGRHDADVGRALATAADHARKAVLECQGQQRIVHAAASSVVAHLDGLARQVLAHANRAGVYASTGALSGSHAVRGVDLVS
ncbi:MAG: hypothetical protein RIE77_07220 [Phycisphaerales bacterium]|jgi:predicted transcriptional regulator